MKGFRTLKEGDSVVYDLLDGPKGLQAVNVTRAE
jgi:cold shock CspA family protein